MAAPAAQCAAPGGEAGAAVLAQDIDLWLLQRIEDSSLNASEPPQQRRLDGWIVRTCPGKAKRARSVQPVALGQRSVQSKLIECEALFREAGLPLVVRLTELRMPTVAMVQGIAAGAGASLALACDMVLAAESAAFMLPFHGMPFL